MVEKTDKILKPGKLIQRPDGKIGLLVERYDFYARKGISSRDYRPKWHWSISWLGSPPLDYISEYGIPENYIYKFIEVIE